MNNKPIVKEVILNATASRIWKAITDKEDMKHWYFQLKEFKLEVGFEFKFYGGSKKKRYLHLCKITEVTPKKKIAYSWKYEGYKGESFVTFELFAQGNKTKVRLTHEGLESFPRDNPDLAKKNFIKGWTHIIGVSLKKYIEEN